MYVEITLMAYIIDKVFGEFNFIKHPVIFMGDYIKWFEKKHYKDDNFTGFILFISLIFIVFCISYIVSFLPWYLLGIVASTGIATKMLYTSVKNIITNPKDIKFLVSRDTIELNTSDINKAAVETYAENLSDGVIAPLFYLLLFGIVGLFVYKAINTLDSMVGYKNNRYINFGKVSAKIDDIVNYIPSRITAFLIATLFMSIDSFKSILKFAKFHESPNAGYPISAIAGAINIKLGGDTKYDGKVKTKPYFGYGTKNIKIKHIFNALSLQIRLDIFIVAALILLQISQL